MNILEMLGIRIGKPHVPVPKGPISPARTAKEMEKPINGMHRYYGDPSANHGPSAEGIEQAAKIAIEEQRLRRQSEMYSKSNRHPIANEEF